MALPGQSALIYDSGWVSGTFLRTVNCSNEQNLKVYVGASGAIAPPSASVNWIMDGNIGSLGAVVLPAAGKYTVTDYGPGTFNSGVIPGNVYLSGVAGVTGAISSYMRFVVEGR